MKHVTFEFVLQVHAADPVFFGKWIRAVQVSHSRTPRYFPENDFARATRYGSSAAAMAAGDESSFHVSPVAVRVTAEVVR